MQVIGHRNDALGVVAIEAGNEAGHHADPPLVQAIDRLVVLDDSVLGLVGIGERTVTEGFDAEEDPDAAGGLQEIEELLVAHDVETRLREPPAFARDHAAQEFLDVRAPRRQVVVPEPDDLALPPMRESVVVDVGEKRLRRDGCESRG